MRGISAKPVTRNGDGFWMDGIGRRVNNIAEWRCVEKWLCEYYVNYVPCSYADKLRAPVSVAVPPVVSDYCDAVRPSWTDF